MSHVILLFDALSGFIRYAYKNANLQVISFDWHYMGSWDETIEQVIVWVRIIIIFINLGIFMIDYTNNTKNNLGKQGWAWKKISNNDHKKALDSVVLFALIC